MKYKVGDRVKIKSLDWYNENSDDDYNVVFADGWHFSEPMSIFCGNELIIEKISHATNPPHYIMKDNMFAWTDEMIEGLVEEETSQNAKLVSERFSEYVNPSEFKYAQDTITKMLLQGANIPNEYILKDENGNVINATKIVLEKKKKEYPKTYEECYQITGLLKTSDIYGYKNGLLFDFQKLLIARDAYWKIAGEEMGLGKPWEPDGNPVYAITRNDGYIVEIETGGNDEVFEFPTEEMRDAFYENFKSEIEICKELL